MNRRKVLWFINKVPAPIATDSTGVLGGWLDCYLEIIGREEDIDLTVAYASPPGTEGESRVDDVTFVGLPTGERRTLFGRVAGRWRHDVAPAVLLEASTRLIARVAPDLIHVHGAEMCYGLAVRGCGIPTVLSVQGSPTAGRQLYLRGVDRHYIRALSFLDFLKGFGPIHGAVNMKRQAAMEAVSMSAVGHVAGRTEWDRHLASVMAPQAVYHHCDEPLRAPFHDFAWCPEETVPGRIVCITSGSYTGKGIGTLLRAIAVLRRSHPEITLLIARVPRATDDGRATSNHVHALGLEDCVTLSGDLDASTVAGELARATAFVNPSHWENGSNTLSEAQLVGVPCVATCAGGMVTTADHGAAALLVQDGDAEALAGALLSLMDDPVEAARLGARGRALAQARHDRDRIRAQVITMYDAMLG